MDRPLIELFVKASSVDPGDKGACPFSQRWFMVFYVFVERQLVNLRVVPVSSANPPAEYLKYDIGKQLPAIAFYKNSDGNNKDRKADAIYSGNDELEAFMKEKFGSLMKMDGKEQWVGADLLRSLNHLLITGSSNQVINNLSAINEHLERTGTAFLESNELSYSDCVLACKVHHVRIAGSFFQAFEIPEEFVYLWAYLKAVYATRAFDVSCPLDRDILLHYLEKVDFVSQEARNRAHHEIIVLPRDQKSTIPADYSKTASQLPRLSCSGVRLSLKSLIPVIEYDKTVKARLSKLYSASG